MNLHYFPSPDPVASPRLVAVARVAIALLGDATPIARYGEGAVSVGRFNDSEPHARILVWPSWDAVVDGPEDRTHLSVESWRKNLVPVEGLDRSAFGLARAFVDLVGPDAALASVAPEELFK